MDVRTAARLTRQVAQKNKVWKWASVILPKAISYGHILWMCEQITTNEIQGEKAHRWLGWVQACCCFTFSATLTQMKLINYEA